MHSAASGADVDGLVIDPPDNWCTFTMQLSKRTDLPLMSYKFGRTPIYQARSLVESVANMKVDRTLAAHLNTKPILVAIYKPVINKPDSYVPTQHEPARTALKSGERFAQALQLPLVFENDSLAYYCWDWQTTKRDSIRNSPSR
jgi:hypothetical protein